MEKREIKFRGKRVDNGEWIYGWLFKDYLTGHLAIQQTTSQILEDRGHQCIETISRDIVPDTEGQYTGLKDKNGVEIYEGDIVKGCFITEDVEAYIFEYLTDEERETGSKLFTVDDIHFGYSSPVPDDLEVIGNIYEHPSLIPQHSTQEK